MISTSFILAVLNGVTSVTFVEKMYVRNIPYINSKAPRQYTALPEGGGRASTEIQPLDIIVTNTKNHKTICG